MPDQYRGYFNRDAVFGPMPLADYRAFVRDYGQAVKAAINELPPDIRNLTNEQAKDLLDDIAPAARQQVLNRMGYYE
jgi:hypothetical protein